MDWNARLRRRTLLRAPDGGLHITPDGGTWQRRKQKKDRPCGLSPSLDARRPRYWLKEEETSGRTDGEANGQCAERGPVAVLNSLARAPFARDRAPLAASSARSQRSACSMCARVALAHGLRQRSV